MFSLIGCWVQMCGRFVLGDSNWAQYHDALSLVDGAKQDISYNIKPTQSVALAFISEGRIKADHARWWFVPHWHKGKVTDWKATTFNARIESAATKPSFRAPWKAGRCIIPASGYYEWTGEKGKKTPWFISPQSNVPIFFFAGLYSRLTDGLMSCSILTRSALSDIQHIHPRTPVMLSADEILPWLNHSASDDEVIDTFGTSWDGRMTYHKVHPFGVKDEGPELIKPAD